MRTLTGSESDEVRGWLPEACSHRKEDLGVLQWEEDLIDFASGFGDFIPPAKQLMTSPCYAQQLP